MKTIKRIIVAIVGTTVVLIGIAMLVLPGPGFLVLAAGLGILALEFAWARRWLRRAQSMYSDPAAKARSDASISNEGRSSESQETITPRESDP